MLQLQAGANQKPSASQRWRLPAVRLCNAGSRLRYGKGVSRNDKSTATKPTLKIMPAQSVHKITYEFELALCKYTGAPFAIAVDNATNAIELCLWRWKESHKLNLLIEKISIPSRTYPSVAAEIKLAGFNIKFEPVEGNTLTGEYQLKPTNIWDSALRFTADMYREGQLQCVSFTGPYKHLKLGKGGAILLDNEDDYNWFKKARNSGRDECSYHEDTFTQLGRNCYLMPDIAARGLLLMGQFYDLKGNKIHNEDKTLPYPDLSDPKHTAFK